MKQLGRPRGLIDYATLEDCEAERKGGTPRPVSKALFHTLLGVAGVRTAVYEPALDLTHGCRPNR